MVAGAQATRQDLRPEREWRLLLGPCRELAYHCSLRAVSRRADRGGRRSYPGAPFAVSVHAGLSHRFRRLGALEAACSAGVGPVAAVIEPIRISPLPKVV